MVVVEDKENNINAESNNQHMEVTLGANHSVRSPLHMTQNPLSGNDSDDEEDRKEGPVFQKDKTFS